MIDPYSVAVAWFALGVVAGVCATIVVVAGLDRRPDPVSGDNVISLAERKDQRRG